MTSFAPISALSRNVDAANFGQASTSLTARGKKTIGKPNLVTVSTRLMPNGRLALDKSPVYSEQGQVSTEERLFSSLVELKVLTSQFSMHLPSAWRKRLFSRLDILYDVENWSSDDTVISVSSFRSFLRATLTYEPLSNTSFGISNNGNFLTAWKVEDTSLSFEYADGDAVQWSFAKGNLPEGEVSAGFTKVAELTRVIAFSGLHSLFGKPYGR